MKELFDIVNSVTPLGAIVLLAYIIYMQVKSKQDASQKLTTIADNHLHGLPDMAATLQRIEVTLTAMDSFLRTRLDGRE